MMTEADKRVLALLETARVAMIDAADAVNGHLDGDMEICVAKGLGWHLEIDGNGILQLITQLGNAVHETIVARVQFEEHTRHRGLRVENC